MDTLGCEKLKACRLKSHTDWPQGRHGVARFPCHSSRARTARAETPHAITIQYNLEAGLRSIPSHIAAMSICGCGSPCGTRTAIVARSTSAVEVLGRQLSKEEESTWQESCDVLVSALGLSADDSSRLLARAFGWTTQAFWRQEKVEELPTPAQVAGALELLRGELEMTTEEAARVVRLFPEVLACDVEGRLRANVAQLGSQWRLKGPTLTKAVLRQPALLGYSVDCGGDCIGECNRCWARF